MNYKIRLAVILFLTSICFPQIEENPDKDFSKFFEVGGDIFSSPSEFNSADWKILSGVTILTAGSFIIDNSIREFTINNRSDFLNAISNIDDYYHLETMGISILGLYTYGLAGDDNEIRNLGLQLAEATIYSSAINFVVKILMGRSRPYLEKGIASFNPFNFSFDKTSFPSLHSTLAFSFSTILADYIDNTFWKIGWFTVAGFVGLARIYKDQHWFSDVLLGSAIGYFVGEFVSNHSTNKKKEELNPNSISKFNIAFNFAF